MRVTKDDGVMVRLDGEPVDDFISADDEGGWVRVSADAVKRGKVEIINAGHDYPGRSPRKT